MPTTDFAFLLSAAAYGCVTVLGVAFFAFGIRRWRLAAALGRAATLAGPVVFLVGLVAFVIIPRAPDPSMQATVLAHGISEIANCGGPALVATLPAAIIWRAARRRARDAAR
jgi:hypothetical protein